MQICMNVVIGRYISDVVQINDVFSLNQKNKFSMLDCAHSSVICIVLEIVLISTTSYFVLFVVLRSISRCHHHLKIYDEILG